MDIDCDGDQSDPGDGRCGTSEDTQSQTAFKDMVQSYSNGTVDDLNANYIPYVVFGNGGTKEGYTNFEPAQWGIKPLSVMAVVCGDKLVRRSASYTVPQKLIMLGLWRVGRHQRRRRSAACG
jgi:hypothetical protein